MSAQSTNSEIRKMSNNQPILCIPGVFANIKEERIRRVFGDLNLGDVDRVDIVVPKKLVGAEEKENKFNRVFVHLIWNDTPSSVACRKKLLEGKEVKIIYDEPWFWRVSAYRPPAPKPRFESQSKPRTFQPKKATLELDFEPEEVKYSGVIAPAMNIVAQALSISIPLPENNKEPKSPKVLLQPKNNTIILGWKSKICRLLTMAMSNQHQEENIKLLFRRKHAAKNQKINKVVYSVVCSL